MTGSVKLNTPSAGSVTLSPADTASNVTVTIPASTATLVNASSTQTLTNKTLTAAGSNTVEATSGPTSTQLAGMRNKIINGAMMIDQRNAGASLTPANNAFIIDRWAYCSSQASKFTAQQNQGSVTPPAGAKNYLGVTSSSSYSVTSTDYFFLVQRIEGLNCADLNWGTASAQSVSVSFKVYSSLTGTFGALLSCDGDTRTYPFSYTISSANTWTTISVTIPGDTSGTWLTTNGVGINLMFSLGAGSSRSGTSGAWVGSAFYGVTGQQNVVGTNGATFYITGVQLEKGATATPFENRLIGTELALCQRYYQKSWNVGTAVGTSTATGIYMARAYNTDTFMIDLNHPLRVSMRTNPTMTGYSTGGNAGFITVASANKAISSINDPGENTTGYPQLSSGPASGDDCRWHWTASAEL